MGIRFRLFPKPPAAHPDWQPETVQVSGVPGTIGPGPSDSRMYLLNPIGKRQPYGVANGPYGTPYLSFPPWRGAHERPVLPGPGGHFDHIPTGTPEFAEAHVFGTICFVLDIWENYLGRPIAWHFAADFPRLEILLLPSLDNAHVGYGFMEVGAHHRADGSLVPYATNFDVLAHELGHLIIYGTLGVPSRDGEAGEYFGFQESAADLTALIAGLHFRSLQRQILEETRGNLYTFNELNRFAELGPSEQIRLASNSVKLSAFAAGWSDEHALSQPLTGAIFDVFVDIFQEMLVEGGLILRSAADLARLVENSPETAAQIQPVFDVAYAGNPGGFLDVLLAARDYLGFALAATWERLTADFFSYATVGEILLDVDNALSGGLYRRAIVESFAWREIGAVAIGPRLAKPGKHSHTHSARTIVPQMHRHLPKMNFHEKLLVARGLA